MTEPASPPAPHTVLDEGVAAVSRYRSLPERFYAEVGPEAVGKDPILVHLNREVLPLAGLSPKAAPPELVGILSGHEPVPGAVPFAGVYAGHQFGSFVPQLGDGRAVTILEARLGDGSPAEVQLKGAGRTPFSRFGDGRAVMRSTIREYLCSEHMAALGIPTTRALSIVASREGVQRETVEPGAVLARVAPSHLRFGHVEFPHYRGDPDGVKAFLDFALAHAFPHLADETDPYGALFAEVADRTVKLVAQWQAVGFAHGVMNTDNMSLLGLTIDYGPFGFVETFDPEFICNHTDHTGRYAFGRQPEIALWNLQALAAALSGVVDVEALRQTLEGCAETYRAAFYSAMGDKFGVRLNAGMEADRQFVTDFLVMLYKAKADYTESFRSLSDIVMARQEADILTAAMGDGVSASIVQEWHGRWRARLDEEDERAVRSRMSRANPAVVLRNWVAETAIRAVEDEMDFDTLDRIFRIVTHPYDMPGGEDRRFAEPAPAHLRNLCVSCSS